MKANRSARADAGNAAPAALLILVTLVYIFEALLFAQVMAEKRFPEFGVDRTDCDQIREEDFDAPFGIGAMQYFFARVACGLDNLGAALGDVWAGVGWFVDLLTFNIPGAPPLVRFGLFGTVCSILLWSVIALLRG